MLDTYLNNMTFFQNPVARIEPEPSGVSVMDTSKEKNDEPVAGLFGHPFIFTSYMNVCDIRIVYDINLSFDVTLFVRLYY